MRLYIAGPLFTPYHRAFHSENVRRFREAGYDCFVPQEQEHNARQVQNVPSNVFKVDLGGLRRANVVVALLDDPDVSSGTACEMGIFYEMARHDPQKIGIVGLLTDDRPRRRDSSNVGESINFFTLGSVLKIGPVVHSTDDVLEQLARWRSQLEEGMR